MSYITKNGKRVVEGDLFVEGLVEQFFENEHREFYIESMKECLEEIYFGCDLENQKFGVVLEIFPNIVNMDNNDSVLCANNEYSVIPFNCIETDEKLAIDFWTNVLKNNFDGEFEIIVE